MADHLLAEARRLRAVADEARARYDALNERREAALEDCRPGPSPELLASALNTWFAAEAAAETAAKMAKQQEAA